MRVDRCDFSGYKVYPSRGKVYVRGDSKVRIRAQRRKRGGGARRQAWRGMEGHGMAQDGVVLGEDKEGEGSREGVERDVGELFEELSRRRSAPA